MTKATETDILRIFPGIADHAVTELLGERPSVDELEAAMLSLAADDESIVEVEHRKGSRLHRLVGILHEAGLELPDPSDR